MLWRKKSSSPPTPCFISQGYRDDLADAAVCALPKRVTPIVFPPIEVRPNEFVSDHLITALASARSVLVADGPEARKSFWVAFETFFAARAGKPIFRFNPETNEIIRDLTLRPSPPIFASYHRLDAQVVAKICDWLEEARGFKVWRDAEDLHPGEDFKKSIEAGLQGTLLAGGYVLAFMSSNSVHSQWVENELRFAMDRFPGQIFLACLGAEDVVVPKSIRSAMWHHHPDEWRIRIGGLDAGSDFAGANLNNLDDLMVRVLFMIHQRQGRLP